MTAFAPCGYNYQIKRQDEVFSGGYRNWKAILLRQVRRRVRRYARLGAGQHQMLRGDDEQKVKRRKESANAESARKTLPMRDVRDDGSLHQARRGRHTLLRSRDAGAAAEKAPIVRLARAFQGERADGSRPSARAVRLNRPRFLAPPHIRLRRESRARAAAHGSISKSRLFSTRSGYSMPDAPTRFKTVPRMKFRSSERLPDDMDSMYGSTSDGVSRTNL